MKNLMLICAAAILSACVMPEGGMKISQSPLMTKLTQADRQYVDETVEVVTVPAGARVQVNDGFVGYSPVKAVVRRYWNGEPGSMVLDTVKIEALPVQDGQCAQGGTFGDGSRKAPAPVSFDMTACSADTPRYRSQ